MEEYNLKLFLKIALAVVLLFSTTSFVGLESSAATYPALTPLKKVQTATTKTAVTMYVKPDTKTRIVAKISKGKFVSITRSNKNWYFITYGDNLQGYIPTNTVDLHSSVIKKDLGYSIHMKKINVYSSPSLNAPSKTYNGMFYPKVEYQTMDGKWIVVTDGKKDYYVPMNKAYLKQNKGYKGKNTCLDDRLPTCNVQLDSLNATILKIGLEKILIEAITGKAFDKLTAAQIEYALKQLEDLEEKVIKELIKKRLSSSIPYLGALNNIIDAAFQPEEFVKQYLNRFAASAYIKLRSVNIDRGITINMNVGFITSIKAQ